MRYVLTINPTIGGFGTHDPAAALFADGELVFAAEEGRLLGRKRAPETFPTTAIERALDHAGIDGRAVDLVTVPWDGSLGRSDGGAESENGGDDRGRTRVRRALTGAIGAEPPVRWVNHHRSHAASAFGPSGFDEALVLTIDGRGARDSTVVWHGTAAGLERVRRYEAPNSLGYLYAAVTGYLGFQPFGGEGKTMALAAYGTDGSAELARLRGVVRGGVEYDVTGLVGSGVPTAITRLERLLDAPRVSSREGFRPREAALASAVQGLLEETVGEICETYCEELGVSRVCLAGGVGLNCKLNQRLSASPAVDALFVQPVAHDAGAALGAPIVLGEAESLPSTLYWGPGIEGEAVGALLDRRGIEYSTPADLERTVAGALADGKLVGWVQGRLEVGPRALGNRSVLADPRSAGARDRVNGFVKGRAAWRPFAPSVPLGAADRYFEGPLPLPYMIRTVDVDPDREGEIRAALHPGDLTARPQTVRERENPRFHRLLEAFGELTGVSVLLNTSFNEAGEPIVATAVDAVETFERTGLDLLVVGEYVVGSSGEPV